VTAHNSATGRGPVSAEQAVAPAVRAIAAGPGRRRVDRLLSSRAHIDRNSAPSGRVRKRIHILSSTRSRSARLPRREHPAVQLLRR